MENVLPAQSGLTVNSVFYRYTTVKNPLDDMIVHVQNEDALGSGYIFRSSDDWSGLPGNTINKLIGVESIPRERWGNGSIEVEGFGTVENSSVIYSYRYDTCFQNTVDPACPGYIPPPLPTVDAFSDEELIQKAMEPENNWNPNKEDEERRAFVNAQKRKLEKALGGINSALMTAQAETAAALFFAMNPVPVSYTASLPGGVYEETIQYSSEQLQDNSKGRRAVFASQLLHEEMVQLQYRGAESTGEK